MKKRKSWLVAGLKTGVPSHWQVMVGSYLLLTLLGVIFEETPVSSQETDLKRPAIFDTPTNFSALPELPKLPPVDETAVIQAIERGVSFLLDSQNPNGSWGSATRTKSLNIYAPVPGAHHAFRMGTTGLAVSSLVESRIRLDDYFSKQQLQRIDQTIDRCEAWVFENTPKLRRATGDALYNVWGHAYSILALVRLRERPIVGIESLKMTERIEKIDQLIRQQIDLLDRYESVDGGWGYYDFNYQAKKPTADSSSFTSGTVLVALYDAQQVGVEPPSRLIQRAINSLHRQQKPDFSYLYGEYLKYQPMRDINRPAGSLGRSQVCNLALRLWGDQKITDQVIGHWLLRLYVRNGWLSIGRKRPIPHESWFAVAGYFYYYGHYYAAKSISVLPKDQRPPYQAMLAEILLPLQEEDGSWWDYPLYNYHQPYGTGYAIMSLLRCLPENRTR